MATAHADDLGIYLWTNTSLYTHVILKALPADSVAREIQLPIATTSGLSEGKNQYIVNETRFKTLASF